MAVNPGALLAALAGVAGVGGFLWWKKRQEQKPAASQTSACASYLQPLGRVVGYDIPPEACGVVDKVVGAVTGAIEKKFESWDEKDRENQKLNGEPAIELRKEVRELSQRFQNQGRPMRGSVARYRNGCEPYSGAPGWSKCASGTRDMREAPGGMSVMLASPPTMIGSDAKFEADYQRNKRNEPMEHITDFVNFALFLSGTPGDPTTQLKVKHGGHYWIAGQPFDCDQTPVAVRDHREGHEGEVTARCLSGITYPQIIGDDPAFEAGGTGTRISFGGDVQKAAPEGYVWVGDHLERKRA